MKNLIYIAAVIGLFGLAACNKTDEDSPTEDYLIKESLFNANSLLSFERITATLEDGTTAECFQLSFSSNPVANGPFCAETVNDVAGLSVYDGATNPGLRLWAADFLNDMEADGYDIVDSNGNVNIYDFVSGTINMNQSNCLDAAPNDDLELTFIIPANPKLAASNNDIEEVELIGLSLDGVPINGDPPSAINGPAMNGPGGGPGGTGGTATEINIPSLDPCGGHHDPAGYYHWHFVPQVMNQVLVANGITATSCTKITQTTSTELVGFAKDGFPIYAYATPPTDLDDCGGRTAITNEYPDGVYHYVASTTSAPNVPQCLKGVAAQNAFQYN